MASENNVWGTPPGRAQDYTPGTPPGTEINAKVSLTTTVKSGDSVLTPKVLGQLLPSAATLTALYTVPANTHTDITGLFVANSGVDTTFSVSLAIAGAADASKQYLFTLNPIKANQTIFIPGIQLAPTDVIRVLATLATVSFVLCGIESVPRV